jgi:hypothetical protein
MASNGIKIKNPALNRVLSDQQFLSAGLFEKY